MDIRDNARLKRKYGVDLADHATLLAAQGGGCYICGGGTTRRRLFVDHNHKNGNVRGLLCGRCNNGLGLFRDKLELVRKAADYLENDGAWVASALGKPSYTRQYRRLTET